MGFSSLSVEKDQKIVMKRKGNLFERIINIINLRAADYRAQKGKNRQKDVINHNL